MTNQQGFPNINAPFVDPERRGQINQAWLQLLINLWNRTGAAQGGATTITGEIKAFAGDDVPDGYLVCDGSAVSRSAFQNLYNTIGTLWGTGDGSTTFNLPNLIGRFPVGSSTVPVGSSGGSDQVTLTVSNLPSHSHSVTDPGHNHGITDPQHNHTIPTGTVAGSGAVQNNVNPSGTLNTGSSSTGVTVNSNTTGVTIGNTGGGAPVDVTPPFAVVLYIIKT